MLSKAILWIPRHVFMQKIAYNYLKGLDIKIIGKKIKITTRQH